MNLVHGGRLLTHVAQRFALCIVFVVGVLTIPSLARAQSVVLEEQTSNGGPAGSGPTVSNQVVTLRQNTDNPTASTFAAYNGPVTVTYILDNQRYTGLDNAQFPAGGNGVAFGGALSGNTNAMVAAILYPALNTIGAPANAYFTSSGTSTAGQGISVTQNAGVELMVSARALHVQASPPATTSKVPMADLTLRFSQPVNNPIVHFSAMGGFMGSAASGGALGFTSEFALITPGLTLTRLSGNTAFVVSGADITNSAITPSTACNAADSAACGSVKVVGTNITEIKFTVYLRGDGGNTSWNGDSATPTAAHGGDQALISVSLDATRKLTVQKSLSPATDGGQFVMNANGTAGAVGSDGAIANAWVNVGATATFAESASGATTLTNYTSTYKCYETATPANVVVASASGTSGSFTMPDKDVTCLITNTRNLVEPTLAKSFNPSSIAAGSTSDLIITISNPNASAITTTAALTDTLPLYVQLSGAPLKNTCSGTVNVTPGANEGVRDVVTLASGATIPAGSCTITVPVKAHIAGTMTNTIAAGSLQTNAGTYSTDASANLTVTLTGPAAASAQQCALDSGTTTFNTSNGTITSVATTGTPQTPPSPAITATYTQTSSSSGYAASAAVPASAPTSGATPNNYLNFPFLSTPSLSSDNFTINYSVTVPTGVTNVVRYYGGNAGGGGTTEASLYTFVWSGGGSATVYEVDSASTATYLASPLGPPDFAAFSATANGEIEFVNGQPIAVGSSAQITSGGTVQTFAFQNNVPSWYIEFPANATGIKVQKVVNSGAQALGGVTTCGAANRCIYGKDALWPNPGTTGPTAASMGETAPGESFNEWGYFETYLCGIKPTITLNKVMPTGASNSTFNFTLTNTSQTTGAVTIASASTTPVQVDGDTATTGTQLFTTTTALPATTDVTIAETVPTNFKLTSLQCKDSGGNVVGSSSGSTYTIPKASLTSGSTFVCTFTNDSTAADLAITKTNTPGVNNNVDQTSDTVTSGQSTTYTITVSNNGPAAATNAIVKDTVVSNLSGCAVVAGSCTAVNGATCPTEGIAAGQLSMTNLTGAGVQIPSLPGSATVPGTVSFQVKCNVQ